MALQVKGSPLLFPYSAGASPSRVGPTYISASQSLFIWLRTVHAYLFLPFALNRQECRFKRRELERIRDGSAEKLGMLTNLRDELGFSLEQYQNDAPRRQPPAGITDFISTLEKTATPGESSVSEVTPAIQKLSHSVFPAHAERHNVVYHKHSRPSRITQIWPRLVLAPPLILYGIHWTISSRATLEQFANDAKETFIGFVRDWLYEPLMGIMATVRTNKDEGMLMSKEGINADVEVKSIPYITSHMYTALTNT